MNSFPELACIDVHIFLASWQLCLYEISSRKTHFHTETRCTPGLHFYTLWGLNMMGRLWKLALGVICKRKQDLKHNGYIISLDFTVIQSALIHLFLGPYKSCESELCLLTNKGQLQKSSAGHHQNFLYASHLLLLLAQLWEYQERKIKPSSYSWPHSCWHSLFEWFPAKIIPHSEHNCENYMNSVCTAIVI